MRRALAALLATLIGSSPAVLGAQQGSAAAQAGPAGTPRQAKVPPPPPPPSVESLGVSFDRIRRQLDQKPATKSQTPLKLEYYVEVIGEAPPFLLFAPDEPSFGPVPGAAPSHADMMRHITPLAFSAPAATLVSFGAKRGSPKLAGYDFWQTQTQMAQELARRKRAEAERERLRKLKESVVVSPPKDPGGQAPRP
jgi:hypothetical protein